MADDTCKVRIEEQLKVKIGEAKNICSRSNGGAAVARDVYCTIALDQEEICRTPTIEKTLGPFFGEEYKFKIPRTFRYLSVYVWDRDRHLKQDKAIGKIAIRREDLHKYNHNKDHWFSLRPVDADSEVQGMAHVEISFEDGLSYIKRSEEYDDTVHDMRRIQNEYKENDGHLRNSRTSSQFTGTFVKNRVIGTGPCNFKDEPIGNVAIRVVECVDLAKKNGGCDPCVTFTALYSNNRKIVKRTKVRKKTTNPHFDETIFFDLTVDIDSKHESSNNGYTIHPLGGSDLCEISITIWHDTPGMCDKFLGEIKIPMRGKQQQAALQSDAWYFLQPRQSLSRPTQSCATPPGTRLSSDSSIGSLRLQLTYTADQVFPLATYDSLMDLLLESYDQKPITISAVHVLGEIISCKTDVAQPLVRLFTYKNLIAPMIKVLADHEISNLTDSTTIFRGNTLVSKMMDEAMRLSGLHYLHNTLRPVLDIILQEKKPCEIDPTRVKDKSVIDTNLVNLQDYVEKVFDAIIKSAVKCPTVLCQIFHDLRECAAKHFPNNREVRYSVVCGFIFLRFFAPAILGPKLFDLTSEPLDTQTNRTLTLISKTIQSLGNLVSSRSAQQTCKEEYTEQLYKKFCTEKHVEAAKHFLEVVSTVGSDNSSETILEPVLLKEGFMAKRPYSRRRFRRRNFKQRFFRLTTHSLSYSKSKLKRPICDIPLSEISSVERVNESCFKMQNIIKIVRKDRALYIQATNCVEEKEWVDLLSKICQSNSVRTQLYHNGVFVCGKYTCCSRTDENSEGCSRYPNKPFLVELATPLDPSKDLQRLHTLIMSNIHFLKTFLDPSSCHQTTTISDDVVNCRQTIRKLVEIACNLDQIHRKYKFDLVRELRYGSRQAPIGDDNYLHLMRSGFGSSLVKTQQFQTIYGQGPLSNLSSVCYSGQDSFKHSISDKHGNLSSSKK